METVDYTRCKTGGQDLAYKRADGIYVVPISCLKV